MKVPSEKDGNDRKIVITGYEENAKAAKLEIEKIVEDLVWNLLTFVVFSIELFKLNYYILIC